MPLLVIETQHKLPVVLGASGDPVSADRPSAKARRSNRRRDEDHRDQDDRADQKPSHVFRASSSALWLEHRQFVKAVHAELRRKEWNARIARYFVSTWEQMATHEIH